MSKTNMKRLLYVLFIVLLLATFGAGSAVGQAQGKQRCETLRELIQEAVSEKCVTDPEIVVEFSDDWFEIDVPDCVCDCPDPCPSSEETWDCLEGVEEEVQTKDKIDFNPYKGKEWNQYLLVGPVLDASFNGGVIGLTADNGKHGLFFLGVLGNPGKKHWEAYNVTYDDCFGGSCSYLPTIEPVQFTYEPEDRMLVMGYKYKFMED